MATRVTASEVKEIIDTDLTEAQVEPFITSANIIVTEELASKGLSENRLTQIELYLSAHLVTLRDPRVRTVGTGDTNISFEGRFHFGEGLESTTYGQTAIQLDTTGTLKNLGRQKPAKIRVFGATDR